MRFVTDLPPPFFNLGSDELKKVDEIRPVRPKRVNGQPAHDVEQYKLQALPQQRPTDNDQNGLGRRAVIPEERRKVCMRFRQQSVLVEFRSGKDRRRHNLRASDIVEHIDEKV